MRKVGAALALLVLVAAGAGAYFYYKGAPAAHAGAEAEDRLARLEALGAAPPASAPAGAEDWRAFADAIAGVASVEFGSVDGVVAREVVVTLAGEDAVGVRIDELRAWGLDGDAAASGDGRIADRFDARGVAFFGLGGMVERQADAITDLIGAKVEDMAPEAAVELDTEMDIERYDVGADRVVVDGLTVHPAEAAPAADDAAGSPFLAVVKEIAGANRRASAEAYAFHNMRVAMAFEQAGGDSEMTLTGPFMGAEGWRRGDLDFAAFRGLTFDMKMTVPATETVDEETGELVATPEFPMQVGGGYDFFSMEGLKLAKLYAHLAKGALPPASETDLMSLGVWRVLGERQTFGGRELSYTREATADMSKFHWLIPTDVRFSADGGRYNMGGLFAYVEEMARAGGGESAAGAEQMAQFAAALKETGLDVVPFEFEMTGTWDPQNGATASRLTIESETMGDWRQSFDGALPDFEGVKAMLPAEGEAVDWPGAMAALVQDAALRSASLELEDRGGLDKGFALAVAVAKLAPEDDAGAAMLRNADPADLRISSAAMMRMAAPQAAQAFPPAAGYIAAVADFVQKGGLLRIKAEPPAPFTMALVESEAEAIDANPGRVAELLGLTVVHEPATGEAGKK